MRAADFQVTAFQTMNIINLLLELLLQQHFLFDMLQIKFAYARESEWPLAAVENGSTYFLLYFFDGYAQCRLSNE